MSVRRKHLLHGALVAAATASVGLLAASGEPTQSPPAATSARVVHVEAPSTAGEPLRTDLLNREAQARATSDVFAPHSWQPPPAPPVEAKIEPPAPPPPPVAPALPFALLGALESAEGKPVLYLAEGDRVHAVSEGDTVNDLYRVEALGPEGVVLLYLPLKTRQTLVWSAGK